MSWVRPQITQKVGFLAYHSYNSLVSPSVSPLPYNSDYQKLSSSGNRISPAILFIIVILAVMFFISGTLHLLVRYLIRQRSSSSMSDSSRYPDMSGSDAFQRQLQQLFHLHDSGLDQAFIDALPVFQYREIMGLKEPFDCPVCLCEFTEKDKLRLLPMCSHAFHIDCIDTWLLSNSTCPLCRGTLFAAGFPIENPVFDLEECIQDDGFSSNPGNGIIIGQKPLENDRRINSRRVFSIRLGKFRSSNIGAVGSGEVVQGGETSSSNLDGRRCYSMGSYQYVVAEELQVALCPTVGTSAKVSRGRNGLNVNSSIEGDTDGKKINSRSKGESFSVSKIWQWSKKGKLVSSSDTQMGSSSASNNAGMQWRDGIQGT